MQVAAKMSHVVLKFKKKQYLELGVFEDIIEKICEHRDFIDFYNLNPSEILNFLTRRNIDTILNNK